MLQALLMIAVSPVGIFLFSLVTYNHVANIMNIKSLTAEYLFTNAHDTLIYGLIDHMVFKNYLVDVVSFVLYPIWLMMWSVIWMNV